MNNNKYETDDSYVEQTHQQNEPTNFMSSQIITYLGNKRKILTHITKCLDIIEERESEKQLSMADAFSGSGVVSRLLKTRASSIYVNDCAGYSETINKCFLSSPTKLFMRQVKTYIDKANQLADEDILDEADAWISRYWAPRGEITSDHRVYFTEQNGRRIDIIRNYIETIPEKYRPFLLGPLLVEASIHNNTNGQFTAFYKDGDKGAFGGTKGNDIHRITAPIYIRTQVVHCNETNIYVSRQDTNKWIKNIPYVDVM